MKRVIPFILLALAIPMGVEAAPPQTVGRVLLDVERRGEAWYVHPLNQYRYYLGRPEDALRILQTLGLGISNRDLSRFDSDIALRRRLAGRILLAVESRGEAYYVHPGTLQKHYLATPEDALRVMSGLSLGITSRNLDLIPIASGSDTAPGGGVSNIHQSVPFTSQAPLGEWSDPRQADGCEESSVLMAMKWVRGESLTPQEARAVIIAMSDWEKSRYGYFEDTGVYDTEYRLLREYFGYHNVEVIPNIGSTDIAREIQRGNLVITAIDGTKAPHNFYTPPGPIRHMIVVVGVDAVTGDFIYHDPGTQYGANLRATPAQMDAMLRDYPSGKFLPITETKKNMIVIRK